MEINNELTKELHIFFEHHQLKKNNSNLYKQIHAVYTNYMITVSVCVCVYLCMCVCVCVFYADAHVRRIHSVTLQATR